MASRIIEIEKLPAIVRGKETSSSLLRGEAMAELAASALPQKEAVLAEVLEDPREDTLWRIVAAMVLGRIATPHAARILLHNLPRVDTRIETPILKSLGRIAEGAALDAIDERVRHARTPAVAAAGRFAAALISHRLGLAGHDLPVPAETDLLPPPAGESRTVEFAPAPADLAARVLRDMQRYPYGHVDLDPSHPTRIVCGREVQVLCLNRNAIGPAVAGKALLGIVALQSAETGEHSPAYLLLSRPGHGAGTLDVLATRCSGALALAGSARVAGARVELELRSVRRPGARAIVVRGVLDGGRVESAEARSSLAREPGLRPTVQRPSRARALQA
jgi:hypothetical protein